MGGSRALDASFVANGRLRYDRQIVFGLVILLAFEIGFCLCFIGFGWICPSCFDLVFVNLYTSATRHSPNAETV